LNLLLEFAPMDRQVRNTIYFYSEDWSEFVVKIDIFSGYWVWLISEEYAYFAWVIVGWFWTQFAGFEIGKDFWRVGWDLIVLCCWWFGKLF
jgi:hypothetical protein